MSARPRSTRPVVSVVIPTFNYGHFLGQCLRSVLEQTLPTVEIIVVDDASTDNTADVVRSFAKDAVRYLVHECNRGAAAAQNTGLNSATGEYVGLLGADDVMKRDNLMKKAEILERYRDAALVHSAAELLDEHGKVVAATKGDGNGGMVRIERLFPRILYGNRVVASSVVARRDVLLAEGGFDERLRYAEDWDLWIRLARRFPFAYIAEALVGHRTHSQSLQSQGFRSHMDLDATEHILAKVFARGPLGDEEGLSFENVYWHNYYRQIGNKVEVLPLREAVKLYVDGARRYPRRAITPGSFKVAAKIATRAVVPRRMLQRSRLQRRARRLAGRRRRRDGNTGAHAWSAAK